MLTVLVHTLCAALRRHLPATQPPTPCNAGSCPPADTSSTTATRSWSASTDALTHPSSAKPNLPAISVPWLGGRTARYEFA